MYLLWGKKKEEMAQLFKDMRFLKTSCNFYRSHGYSQSPWFCL